MRFSAFLSNSSGRVNCSRVLINARFSFRFSLASLFLCVYFHLFSCVFRKRERNGAGQISEGPGQVTFA